MKLIYIIKIWYLHNNIKVQQRVSFFQIVVNYYLLFIDFTF